MQGPYHSGQPPIYERWQSILWRPLLLQLRCLHVGCHVNPMHSWCHCTVAPNVPGVRCTPPKFLPTFKAHQVKSEVWMLWFDSPSKHQLDILPQHVFGTPMVFKYHPFCYIDLGSRPTFKNRPHTARRSTFLCMVLNFIWILASCGL